VDVLRHGERTRVVTRPGGEDRHRHPGVLHQRQRRVPRLVEADPAHLGAVADAVELVGVPLRVDRAAELVGGSDRLDEETFWAQWSAAHPRLLGAVLDLAAKVMARLPAVELARKPRMADYARILAAVDAELGTSALERYAQQAADLAAEGLSGDSFASRIQSVIGDSFEGTAADLLAEVKPGDPEWKPPKDWPGSARAVTGKLRRLAPAFRKTGWSVDDLGRGGHGKQIR
jgi:hypothetical protein